jgi:hypothetical protein
MNDLRPMYETTLKLAFGMFEDETDQLGNVRFYTASGSEYYSIAAEPEVEHPTFQYQNPSINKQPFHIIQIAHFFSSNIEVDSGNCGGRVIEQQRQFDK